MKTGQAFSWRYGTKKCVVSLSQIATQLNIISPSHVPLNSYGHLQTSCHAMTDTPTKRGWRLIASDLWETDEERDHWYSPPLTQR